MVDGNKDIELTLRIRNGRLVDAVQEVAKQKNVTVTDLLTRKGKGGLLTSYYELASFRKTPQGKRGIWRQCVLDICEIVGTVPEDLFDLNLYNMPIVKNVVKKYLSKEHLLLLQGSQFAGMLPVESETPEQYMDRVESDDLVRKEITNIIKGKPKRNIEIFKDYFGLDTDREYSLQKLAVKFNVSRERVRQIIKQMVKHIRKNENIVVLKGLLEKV